MVKDQVFCKLITVLVLHLLQFKPCMPVLFYLVYHMINFKIEVARNSYCKCEVCYCTS